MENVVAQGEQNTEKQLIKYKSIVESISAIFTCLYEIDLTDDTFEEILAKDEFIAQAVGKSGYAQDSLDFLCANLMTMDHISDMFDFLQLNTLVDRLQNLSSVSKEYYGLDGDWKETIFIAMERNAGGEVQKVLWGFRTINEEKEKELELQEQSVKDGLTDLFNRRAFDLDVEEIEASGISDDFVFFSMDVNGLKIVNDTLGHEAGDELLLGAADCMKQAFEPYGRIYRTGGDEFLAMIRANDKQLETIKADMDEFTLTWRGELVDKLAISCGFVKKSEQDFMTIHDMETLADQRMYEDKTAYYKRQGVDRRGRAAAHTALFNLYTKILKINITEDTYSIVNMVESERTAEKGFSDKISEWLSGFGRSGQVHKDDLEKYMEKTDIEYLRKHFRESKNAVSVLYRRKVNDEYKQVVMEMIPADDYTDDNQTLFLYVKTLDL